MIDSEFAMTMVAALGVVGLILVFFGTAAMIGWVILAFYDRFIA